MEVSQKIDKMNYPLPAKFPVPLKRSISMKPPMRLSLIHISMCIRDSTSLVQQAFAAACIPQLALIQNGQICTGFLNVADNVSGEEYRLFPGKFPEQLPEPDQMCIRDRTHTSW